MENRYKRNEEKRADRGDLKKSLLKKLFEDLDIADLIPNRDRGDARTNPVRSSRTINYERPNKAKPNADKKRTIQITISEVNPKQIDNIEDFSDPPKREQNTKLVHRDDRKKLEESKGKTALLTVKEDNKLKADNKARVLSEQLIKSKPDAERTEEKAKIDEKIRRIDEKATRAERAKNRLPLKDIKINEKDRQNKNFLEARRLLRQKYTVKLKNEQQKTNRNVENRDGDNGNAKNDNNEAMEQTEEEINTPNEAPKESPQLIPTKTKKVKELIQVQRKPIIKTIRLRNENRVYKAVTFIDQKDYQPTTPLQIKMPNSKKSVETNTVKNKTLKIVVSKVSLQEKKEVFRKKKVLKEKAQRIKKRPSSPVLATCQGCPQTEVAKWAPCSIDQHTKPYYEAWVDTTLAAISKCSTNDKQIFNPQNIIRTFKRTYEMQSRPESPDLVYERSNDEKYMGRITVRQNR